MRTIPAALSAAPVRTVLVLGFILLLAGNWIMPLLDRDEPRFAEATREMLQRQDYLVPYFNGGYRFDKPPLIYWCQALSFRVLGENPFAARLPSAVFATATAVLLVLWGRRLGNERAGFHGGLMFLCCLQVLIHGRLSVADMPLIFFGAAAVWSGWEVLCAEGSKRWRWWAALAASFGLGFLAKGPIAWLPLGGILAARWRRPEVFRSPVWFPLTAFVCGLVPVAVWGIPALRATHGEFLKVGIGRHVIERSFGILDSHGLKGLLGYVALLPLYLLTFFLSFFPWAFHVPGALKRWWARKAADDLGWYLLVQAGLVFVVFTAVRTKLPHYTLPAFPCLGLWLALQWKDGTAPASLVRGLAGMTALTLFLMLGVMPWARSRVASYELWNQVHAVVRPETTVSAMGFNEPSLVWEFRRTITNYVKFFPRRELASELQGAPPHCVIGPTDLMEASRDQYPTNAVVVRTVGVDTASFQRWDLTAVITR